jgi:hypothetical protein
LKNFTKCSPSLFVKFNAQLFPWKRVTQLLLQFSKKLPKEKNCPMGENSPNLATLALQYKQLSIFPGKADASLFLDALVLRTFLRRLRCEADGQSPKLVATQLSSSFT